MTLPSPGFGSRRAISQGARRSQIASILFSLTADGGDHKIARPYMAARPPLQRRGSGWDPSQPESVGLNRGLFLLVLFRLLVLDRAPVGRHSGGDAHPRQQPALDCEPCDEKEDQGEVVHGRIRGRRIVMTQDRIADYRAAASSVEVWAWFELHGIPCVSTLVGGEPPSVRIRSSRRTAAVFHILDLDIQMFVC
jgi:hypothetical protein